MDVYKIPLKDFLGGREKGEGQNEPEDVIIDELCAHMQAGTRVPLEGHPGFVTVGGKDQALYEETADSLIPVGV